MSEVRPEQGWRAARGVFRAALLCAVAAGALLPRPAAAQDTGILRGEISETDVNSVLMGSTALTDRKPATKATSPIKTIEETGVPTPVYQPSSAGATPDPLAETDPNAAQVPTSIFADEQQSDSQPTPGTRPRTAQEREKARKQENEPEEPAARRLADARKKKLAGTEQDTEEDPETTGTVRAGTIDSEEEFKIERESEREAAVDGLDKDKEDNPYAPVGIRVGNFVVSPSAESGVTWSSNADSSAGGEPATLSETTLRLNAISEWGGDKTTFDAFGTYRKTISGDEIEEARGGIDAALERDLGLDWRALASLGYEVGPESASSPDAVVGTLEQPLKHTFDGSLGVEKDLGKLRLRLTAIGEREVFGDAELSTGGTVSQSDRDSTLGALVLRTGYEISPALTPFVELEYGRRIYDEELDSNGFDRSSTRTGARGGLQFDLGEKFSGELSAGWINEDLDDDRLASISGPSLAADILWSPVRGTNLRLNAQTTVEGATGANESGSILHSGRLTMSRELRANLSADVALGAALRDYTGTEGHDTILSAEAGMTWWLNRYAGLTGKARTERLESTLPDRDYTANSVFLGLKLQR